MGTRINIGVYIGPDDTDIAAWFNLLQESNLSRAKWASGLFCAYAMNQKLDIGTINPSAPLIKGNPVGETLLFGSGNSQTEIKKRDRYGFGWQIRGPNREFIQGSVINVSISKAEVLPILNETWQNGHHLATFLKALIRSNLVYGEKASPPRIEVLQKVYSAFLVKQNSQNISAAKERTSKRIDTDIEPPPCTFPHPQESLSGSSPMHRASKQEIIARPGSEQNKNRGKNPLLNLI